MWNTKPPIPRNFPDSSGRIAWARSLLMHLTYFMEHFTSQKTLRHRPEYRHLVRQYNDTGTNLMKFEIGVQGCRPWRAVQSAHALK